jgi:hypothetical protein
MLTHIRFPGARFAAVLVLAGTFAGAAGAQSSAKATPAPHPAVCAQGVRVYNSLSEVTAPYDTLSLPPSDAPIRVTNPDEAAAAELMVRGRAGSVGATGMVVMEKSEDTGGGMRIHREITPVFVRADRARAQQACKGS